MERLTRVLTRNKYVLLVLALGLLLLLLPRPAGSDTAAAPVGSAAPAGVGAPLEVSGIPLDTESERLEALLKSIRGVGTAKVLLSKEGAAVVCAGAGSAAVRLAVTEAVAAYTGLGSDKIAVFQMGKN